MPKIFVNGSRGPDAIKHFEIRLDESNILLRGTRDEAASAVLRGTLVVCLSEPLRVHNVRLRYTGEKRISWSFPGGGSADPKKREEFFRKTWQFRKNPELLAAGNYEWPFELVVPGQTTESLEGLPDSWVIYRLKATIDRGFFHQNCAIRRQVRIIRTLDPAALELAHAMSVDNVWPDKIEYTISTPSKAVIFGSSVAVDFRIVPLLKGLRVGNISIQLSQKQSLTKTTSRGLVRRHGATQVVASENFLLANNVEPENIDGRDGYIFQRSIQIPQSLCKCVQSFDDRGIKIKHHLAFNVQLHNPDGHISELHANLPLYIFLSPHLPFDDHHNLVPGQEPSAGIADLTPPQYGEHVLDLLYSGIDTSGYMTPAGMQSGAATPMTLRSRSVSADNLAILHESSASQTPPTMLQRRLRHLDIPRSRRVSRQSLRASGCYDLPSPRSMPSPSCLRPCPSHDSSVPSPLREASSSSSAASQSSLSRQTSDEDGLPTLDERPPGHLEYGHANLAQVPSYTTALRSNPRTPLSRGLPSYHAATRESSPVRTRPGTSSSTTRSISTPARSAMEVSG